MPRTHHHTHSLWFLLGRILLAVALLAAGSFRRVSAERHVDDIRRRYLFWEAVIEATITQYSQGELVPPSNSADGGGTMVLPHLAPPGTELVSAAENVVPTVDGCSEACREMEECNLFAYCREQAGCYSSSLNLSAPLGGCQLVHQEPTQPGTGRPALMEDAPGFTGGAPLRFEANPVEGYDAFPGLGFWYRHDYSCEDSISQPGSCGLRGSPTEHKERCDVDPYCRVMMFFPAGRDYPGAGKHGIPVVLLKGGPGVLLNITDANFNQNTILYMKQAPPPPPLSPLLPPDGVSNSPSPSSSSSSSGLDPGIIVGVVVGSLTGLGVAAAGGFVLAKRHARQQEAQRAWQVPGTGSGSGSSSEKVKAWMQEGQKAEKGMAGPGATAKQEQVATHCFAPTPQQQPQQFLPPPPSGCPPPPPPTVASSAVLSWRSRGDASAPHPGMVALGPPQPLWDSIPLCPRPDTQALDSLLSHLPPDSWQSSVVEFSSITFCRGPDGSFQELGVGAFAAVYRVLLDGCQPQAAKLLRLGGDPKAHLYFLREASLLRNFRHRAIVGFTGVCVSPDGCGIILMELMEGLDLRHRMMETDETGQRVFGWHRRGKMVAADVASALHYLHSHGYTHFDVKSRNVLLSRDLTAKLADVGFAQAMRTTHHSLSNPTGTFDYLAPELLLARRCTSAVDIFSFGVLCWEIVTGEYPTRGCMRQLRTPEECSPEAAELIMECMSEDPSCRPTARALVERLEQLDQPSGGGADLLPACAV